MTIGSPISGPSAGPTPFAKRAGTQTPDAQDAKLRQSSQQLEGVFVQQMYKAMRDTVPSDGMFSGGSGEQMFTGLLDERMAADTPAKWQHGLSEAIYKHLRQALPGAHANAGGNAAAANAAMNNAAATTSAVAAHSAIQTMTATATAGAIVTGPTARSTPE